MICGNIIRSYKPRLSQEGKTTSNIAALLRLLAEAVAGSAMITLGQLVTQIMLCIPFKARHTCTEKYASTVFKEKTSSLLC